MTLNSQNSLNKESSVSVPDPLALTSDLILALQPRRQPSPAPCTSTASFSTGMSYHTLPALPGPSSPAPHLCLYQQRQCNLGSKVERLHTQVQPIKRHSCLEETTLSDRIKNGRLIQSASLKSSLS